MTHRLERIAHVVRDVVSEALVHQIADPRVSRFTSVTRVEVSGDLRFADVHVSIMGTEAEGRTTMKGLESARGMVQSRLARRIKARQCPHIRFHLDRGLKIAVQTIEKIDELMAEDAERRRVDPSSGSSPPADGPPVPSPSGRASGVDA